MINDNPYGLKPNVMKFCYQYIVDQDVRAALRRAGYSDRSVTNKAGEMLLNKNVVQTIILLQEQLQKRTRITLDKVVIELGKVAFLNAEEYIADIKSTEHVNLLGNKFYSTSVSFKEYEEMPAEVKACIASVKEGREGIELKWYSKMDALDKLMRHLGGYNDKLNSVTDLNVTYKWEDDDDSDGSPGEPDAGGVGHSASTTGSGTGSVGGEKNVEEADEDFGDLLGDDDFEDLL